MMALRVQIPRLAALARDDHGRYRTRAPAHPRTRGGFALMAALWLVVLVGVAGYGLSVRGRSRRLAVANSLERTQAVAAAEAAVETVRGELALRLAPPAQSASRMAQSAPLDPWSDLAALNTDTLALGDARALPRVYDVAARINLNRATEADLRRFLAALAIDAGDADRLAQRIADWRDADDFRRARGAERDDYLRAGARQLPTNADFARADELRDVDGMTPELYARIAPFVTVLGTGQINVNAAPREVLLSLPGMGDESIAAIVRAQRARRPIRSMEELTAQLSSAARSSLVEQMSELQQRAAFESREVVVEADGWLDGSPARVTAQALLARGGDAMFTIGRRIVQ
jgi:type II secretory pathway component PulK